MVALLDARSFGRGTCPSKATTCAPRPAPCALRSIQQIQKLLLDETPIIFSYFYNFLTATAKNLTGIETTAMAHVFVNRGVFL